MTLVLKFKTLSTTFQQQLTPILLFKPETVLKWHRELVRHKWTFEQCRKAGRPGLADDVRQLILKLAGENVR
jgi:hypothetical protein